MPDDPPLRPATHDELRGALGYALRYGRRGKAHNHSAEFTAGIAADVLIEHLKVSGFVVMKKPPIGDSAAAPASGLKLTD